METIEIRDLCKTYETRDGELKAVDDVNMLLGEGEFVSIIGPSGCGKSTIFNIVSGLEQPDSGAVEMNGNDVIGQTGKVSYMMQKDCLFPWRTVLDNVIVGAEVQGMPRYKARKKARELLPVFGLDRFADDYPVRLSGGMRQRAALLRTAMADRGLWLLDEPFGALDALTRDDMQDWLLRIRAKFRRSVLFITHSIDEAIYLSDRVYVLSSRPARVKDEVRIELPRPRTRDLVTDGRFIDYKERLLVSLHQN